MSIYIQSAEQISAQKPLSDEWFDNPVFYEGKCASTINPDFTPYFSPITARRMDMLVKRAVALSRQTLKEASIEIPDAIICGTGLGCIDSVEKFLYSITENDEKLLQPTSFMQSSHNIISSTLSIEMKCHGYNNTYMHRGVSFENALLDAILQFEQNHVQNVLVGGFDELTDDYYKFFEKIGIWNFEIGRSPKEKCFASEAAVSMLLGKTRSERTICEINGIELLYKPTSGQLQETLNTLLAKSGCSLSDIDAILTGLNTHLGNDTVYRNTINRFLGSIPILQYKHLFGESFSSSAICVYVALTCLRKGYAPAILSAYNDKNINPVKRILVYNHFRDKTHSFILLSSC